MITLEEILKSLLTKEVHFLESAQNEKLNVEKETH